MQISMSREKTQLREDPAPDMARAVAAARVRYMGHIRRRPPEHALRTAYGLDLRNTSRSAGQSSPGLHLPRGSLERPGTLPSPARAGTGFWARRKLCRTTSSSSGTSPTTATRTAAPPQAGNTDSSLRRIRGMGARIRDDVKVERISHYFSFISSDTFEPYAFYIKGGRRGVRRVVERQGRWKQKMTLKVVQMSTQVFCLCVVGYHRGSSFCDGGRRANECNLDRSQMMEQDETHGMDLDEVKGIELTSGGQNTAA